MSSKFTSRQWLAIAGSFLLLAGLFFINRKPPATDNPMGQQQESGHAGNAAVDFDQVIKSSEDSLSDFEKQVVSRIKEALAAKADSVHIGLAGHLVNSLDSVGQPIIAAYYTEKLAETIKSPPLWTKAGEKFYDYSELGKDNFKTALLQQAQMCFTSALKIDSNYADAKVGLGECLVDAGGNPMQGIMTIQSVLNKDSNNLNAQIALGKLSIRSNQFEKAIYRFNRVLQIEPTYYKAYLLLAQSYKSTGNIKQEIVSLKKYRTFAADSSFKVDLDKYLQEEQKNDTNK